MAIKTTENPMGALGTKMYTLTVVTSPASATCTLTYDGTSYSTKQVTVKAGTVVSYSVYHSTYGTTSGSVTMNRDKILTCTGTYNTVTTKSLNKAYELTGYTGTSSISIVDSGLTSIASGFAGYGGISLDDTELPTTQTMDRISVLIDIRMPTTWTGTRTKCIIGNRTHVETANNTINSAGWGLHLGATNKKLVLAVKKTDVMTSTNPLELGNTYHIEAHYVAEANPKYTLKYYRYTSTDLSTMTLVETLSSNSTAVPNNTVGTLVRVGNYGRTAKTGFSVATYPFIGEIFLNSIDVLMLYTLSTVTGISYPVEWRGLLSTNQNTYYWNKTIT